MSQAHENVWDALFPPEEAAKWKDASSQMMAVQLAIREKGWTAAQAATCTGFSEARMTDFMAGRFHKFEAEEIAAIHGKVMQ